jgi:homoserine acetyltransferase
VTVGLGLKRLRLILGTSMGDMQTWMWGQRYPGMMDALLSIASLPERVEGRNLLWRRLPMQIIRLGETERTAASEPPTSLGLAWNLFRLMVDSPARLSSALSSPADSGTWTSLPLVTERPTWLPSSEIVGGEYHFDTAGLTFRTTRRTPSFSMRRGLPPSGRQRCVAASPTVYAARASFLRSWRGSLRRILLP